MNVLPTPPLSRLTTIFFLGTAPSRLIFVGTIAQIALIMVARRPVATAADPRADIAKQVNGDREADECEYERMVGMAGKIVGHDESPWHVPGTPICPLTAQQDAAAFAAQPPLSCRGARPDGTSGRHRRQSAQADFSAIPPVRGMAGVTRQGWEIWSGRRRAQPGTQSDPRGRHRRILSVKRWPRQGRGHDSSIFVGEKQRQTARGDVGICRVRGYICHRAIIIIDLPVQGLARELEATEITLPMRDRKSTRLHSRT